jgi:thymidylate synthase ThyX
MNKSLEEQVGVSEDDLRKAYDNAVKANALDFVRDYLPLATLSHIGISANARSYENILIKMLTSPLSESRFVANRMRDELSKLVPSVMKGVNNEHGMEMQKFISERRDNTQIAVDRIMKEVSLGDERAVLVDYTGKDSKDPDKKAQIVIAATIMYRFSHGAGMQHLLERAEQMSEEERKGVIAAYIGNRMNRRHKPGRAFESVDYTFDLTGRIGIYRDLQRHRVCVHERQNFGTELGYDIRKEFADIGIVDDFKSKMEEVKELYNALLPIMPYQAQYVVAFGYNVKWYYRLNARQFFHVCEIRTTPHGHADYRKLVQSMATKVKEVHPTVMEHMKYLNMSQGVLNRLGSEIRIAAKKRAISAKPQ